MKLSGITGIFRKLSLAHKLSVAVTVLVLIITVAVGTLVISFQRRALRMERSGAQFEISKRLAKDAAEPLILKDPLMLDTLVRAACMTPGCVYSSVSDLSGRFTAHTDRKKLGFVPDKGEQSKTRSGYIKNTVVPVLAGYEMLGSVETGFSEEGMEEAVEHDLKGLKRSVSAFGGIACLLGIWGSFALARLLSTPVRELKTMMESVQTGNLNAEIETEDAKRCWDLLDCRETECPARNCAEQGDRCWTVEGTRCSEAGHLPPGINMAGCRKCFVYKEICGDELGELIEVFNRMVRNLRNSRDKLEKAGHEKARLEKFSALGEMSMTVAHEIKNPLNAIRGSVAYLKDNFEGEILMEFLTVIEEETIRLNGIVTNILRYSRPTPVKSSPGDINRVMEETVRLVRNEATENDVEVLMTKDERMPIFAFDAGQLKQAMLNLLVNALDSVQPGGTVKISTAYFGPFMRIIIRDNGSGIDKDVMENIFKPFFSTKTRGSGLGLACVERIVKDHGGDISASSEQGQGAEFIITLPVNRAVA